MLRALALSAIVLTLGCPRPQNQPTSIPVQTPVDTTEALPPEETPPASWLALGPEGPAPAVTEALLEQGRDLYLARCASCHGEAGAGDGPLARKTPILPRDFRQGIFKLRSTPTGSLPTDADLFRTITRGVPGGGMPGMGELSEPERWALVRYLQDLTLADETDEKRDPVTVPDPPPADEGAVARGRGVYLMLRCQNCHGVKGDGQGARSTELIDDWGNPIRVPNLTQPWPYKGGATERDLYRTLVTGLDGSPMPSYTDARWLVSKKDFPPDWEARFSRDLPKEAIADIKVFIDQLPEKLPRSEAELQKLSDRYMYDLVAYLRSAFPRRVKE